jgi:hypothetical protein
MQNGTSIVITISLSIAFAPWKILLHDVFLPESNAYATPQWRIITGK